MSRSAALPLLTAAFLAGCSPTTGPGSPGEQVPETGTVSHVVDGDTIDVNPLRQVRLVGIDTPEQDMCSYAQATAAMTDLVQGRTVLLVHPTAGVDDIDPYGRLLRYVDLPDGTDVGLAQLEAGWARTAYDSTNSYPKHPREATYRAADALVTDLGCYSP